MIIYHLPDSTMTAVRRQICTRSLMDRTEASDAFNAGSIPVECRRKGGMMDHPAFSFARRTAGEKTGGPLVHDEWFLRPEDIVFL